MDIFQTHYTSDKGWLAPLPDYNSERTLILVFGESNLLYDSQPFKQLVEKYPDSIIAGCSTPAGITDNVLLKEGLVISVIRFWSTRLRYYSVEQTQDEDSFTLGECLATHINEDSLTAVITFADGLSVNGSQFMQGISQVVSDDVVVTGGLSATGGRGCSNASKPPCYEWVIHHCRPAKKVAGIIGLYGDSVTVLNSKGSGWKAFGTKRVVTKSFENRLFELDGKPALQIYKKYLGKAASQLPESGLLYPLTIWSGNSGDNVVRSIISIDEGDQSLSFAGDIPQHYSARLMYGTIENLIEGAEEAVDNLPHIVTHSQGVLSIVASCIGRLLVLDADAELEVDAVLGKLPNGARQVGFYSAGEFGIQKKSAYALHNETLMLTVIYEK